MARIITNILLLFSFAAAAQSPRPMFHGHNISCAENLVASGCVTSTILDTYTGASAAYSFRLLRTAYAGNCIQAERVSDGVTQNIGFVSNFLDTGSLKTFAGTSDVRVKIWYDQSGNSKDMTAVGVVTLGPFIAYAGNISYDGGGVAMRTFWSSSGGALHSMMTNASGVTFSSCFAVARMTAYSSINYIAGDNTTGGIYTGGAVVTFDGIGGHASGPTRTARGQNQLWNVYYWAMQTDGLWVARNNRCADYLGSFPTSRTYTHLLSRPTGTTNAFQGFVKEAIFYTATKFSDRICIQHNMNTFYSIY